MTTILTTSSALLRVNTYNVLLISSKPYYKSIFKASLKNTAKSPMKIGDSTESIVMSDLLSERLYEIDPLVCPKCGSEMKILAVIMGSYEINKILKHLAKINKAPPGIDEEEIN